MLVRLLSVGQLCISTHFRAFSCRQFLGCNYYFLINKDESSFAQALIFLMKMQLLGLGPTQVPNTSFVYLYVFSCIHKIISVIQVKSCFVTQVVFDDQNSCSCFRIDQIVCYNNRKRSKRATKQALISFLPPWDHDLRPRHSCCHQNIVLAFQCNCQCEI